MTKERINPWEKIKELEKELRKETEKNDKLKEETDKTSKRLANATKLVAENEEQLRNSRKASVEKGNDLAEVINNLTDERTDLKKLCKAKDTEIKKLQNGRKGWQSRVKTLETQLADAEKILAEPKKLFREAKAEVKSLTKALKTEDNKNRKMRLDLTDSRNSATKWKISYANVMKIFTGEGSTNFFPVTRKFLEDTQSMFKTVIPNPDTESLLQDMDAFITELLASKRLTKLVKEKVEKDSE